MSDGTLEKETRSTAPDRSLYEEFTVRPENHSPLHGAPTAYYAKTGKRVGVLSEEDYLTYVTSVGENFVAQFTTADGYFYGQLLNADCEVLAEFPYLCDVINNVLIFDYPTVICDNHAFMIRAADLGCPYCSWKGTIKTITL